MECKFVPSVCSYCGTGCGVLFEVVNGKIKKTLPMKSHPGEPGKALHQGLEPSRTCEQFYAFEISTDSGERSITKGHLE